MAKIIVTTNDGLPIDEYELDDHGARTFPERTHVGVRNVLSGLARSLEDAVKIEHGEDPRRASEIAMERAQEQLESE